MAVLLHCSQAYRYMFLLRDLYESDSKCDRCDLFVTTSKTTWFRIIRVRNTVDSCSLLKGLSSENPIMYECFVSLIETI